MAAAIPFVMMAAAVVSAVGAIQQGQAAKKASDYNAAINMQNAQIARSDAAAVAEQQDRESYLRLGAIRAAQGKSGGAANEGSVLDVLGDQAAQNELERQNIVYQGEQRARGFTNTATLDVMSGAQAQRSSYFKAGSDLLAGGANSYMAYKKLKQT